MKEARTLAIGISGGSCTGKGTLCEHLARHFAPPPVILTMDSYYHDLSFLPGVQRGERNFDCPEAIDKPLLVEHLRRLLRGEEIEMPRYDFRTHTRARETVKIGSREEVILLEGLFVFYWREIRELTQFKVFIELEAETCLKRRIERDTRERGRTVEAALRQFDTHVLPMYRRYIAPTKSYADLVVRGDAPHEETIQNILRRLRQKTRAAVFECE